MNEGLRNNRRISRGRAMIVGLSIAGALALGPAGPAAAQYTPPEQDGCTEAELHPEYRGMGLCDDSPPPADPAPTPAPGDLFGGLLGGPL